VSIECDQKNLEYFQTSNVLARTQAKLSETLSAKDFVFNNLEGSKNLADWLSVHPNYKFNNERPFAELVPNVSV
jgi:hypothetical protein